MTSLLKASLNPATVIQYQKVWDNVTSFVCNTIGGNMSLPLEVKTIGLYISHLHSIGLQPSTIQSHLSAISYVHKIRDIRDPTQAFLVGKLMISLHKSSPCKDIRLPITRDVLQLLIKAVHRIESNEYNLLMFSAMFSLAYHACLRVGEYTMSANAKNVLQLKQVTTVKQGNLRQALRIHFASFKHSKGREPILEIQAQVDDSCPVLALNKYVSVRPDIAGPLFVNSCGKPVTRLQAKTALDKCSKFLNLDSSRYTTHSLRIGKCTDMVKLGYSDAQIRAVGRWKSDAYKRYIRPSVVVA